MKADEKRWKQMKRNERSWKGRQTKEAETSQSHCCKPKHMHHRWKGTFGDHCTAHEPPMKVDGLTNARLPIGNKLANTNEQKMCNIFFRLSWQGNSFLSVLNVLFLLNLLRVKIVVYQLPYSGFNIRKCSVWFLLLKAVCSLYILLTTLFESKVIKRGQSTKESVPVKESRSSMWKAALTQACIALAGFPPLTRRVQIHHRAIMCWKTTLPTLSCTTVHNINLRCRLQTIKKKSKHSL